MQPAVLIRLRPTGPWRFGPADGARDRTDTLYSNDRLYSAVTLAMQRLGLLEEWLDATARTRRPAVAFTSCFPFQGDTHFIAPPCNVWPPPAALVSAPNPVFLAKIRWSAARFVPVAVIESILSGQPVLADQWLPDAESGCLLRRDRPSFSPFRTVVRSQAAVDRIGRSAALVHTLACVEFESNSGLWCLARYADTAAESAWGDRILAAFRLLADSGFGGRRSSGWGLSEAPVFQRGIWPNILLPKLARILRNGGSSSFENGHASNYWLLSLYSPGQADVIDWTGGDYRVAVRAGRIESALNSGAQKKSVRMLVEGSIVAAVEEPVGAPVDVAPDGFTHPVYRSGFCIALKLPEPSADAAELAPVEMPTDPDAPEPRPCNEPQPAPPLAEIPEQAPSGDDIASERELSPPEGVESKPEPSEPADEL